MRPNRYEQLFDISQFFDLTKCNAPNHLSQGVKATALGVERDMLLCFGFSFCLHYKLALYRSSIYTNGAQRSLR